MCNFELSNVYFQCGGCRTLLNHNFFVCGLCYQAGKHKESTRLDHSCSSMPQSSVNHIVDSAPEKCDSARPCSSLCTQCNLCVTCHCMCHTKFFRRCRFLDITALQRQLKRLKQHTDTQHTNTQHTNTPGNVVI